MTDRTDHPADPPKQRRFGISRGVLLEIAFVVIALFLFYSFQARGLLATDKQSSPDLVLQSLAGATFDLSDNADRPTLVYFFAPWCNICAASSDNIVRLRKWTDEKGLVMVMVALDWQTIDEVSDYAEKHGLNMPILLGDKRTASEWQVYAYPSYYLLDSQRRVVHSDLGYSTLFGLWWRTWLTA